MDWRLMPFFCLTLLLWVEKNEPGGKKVEEDVSYEIHMKLGGIIILLFSANVHLFPSLVPSRRCLVWFIGCPQIQQKWYTYNLLCVLSRDLVRRFHCIPRSDGQKCQIYAYVFHATPFFSGWTDCSWDSSPKSFAQFTRGDLFFCTDLFTKRKNGEPSSSFTKQP